MASNSFEIFGKFFVSLTQGLPKFAPTVNKEVLLVWYESFKHLTENDLKRIYSKAISSFDEFPSMRKLLQLSCDSQFDPDVDAKEASARICSAVSKFGYCNPKEARTYIGELGWMTMERYYGTWEAFCELLTPDNTATVQAQLRDLCRSVGIRSERGHIGPPALPKPRSDYSDLITEACSGTLGQKVLKS